MNDHSTEDLIRDALNARAAEVEPSPDAYAHLARRVTQAPRRPWWQAPRTLWFASAGFAAAAAMLIVVVVATNNPSEDKTNVVAPGPEESTSSPDQTSTDEGPPQETQSATDIAPDEARAILWPLGSPDDTWPTSAEEAAERFYAEVVGIDDVPTIAVDLASRGESTAHVLFRDAVTGEPLNDVRAAAIVNVIDVGSGRVGITEIVEEGGIGSVDLPRPGQEVVGGDLLSVEANLPVEDCPDNAACISARTVVRILTADEDSLVTSFDGWSVRISVPDSVGPALLVGYQHPDDIEGGLPPVHFAIPIEIVCCPPGEVPDPTPPPVPPTPTPIDATQGGAECSASGMAAPPPQPGLPEPVAATRDAIIAAALACDIDALVALTDPDGFTASFGAGSAQELWTRLEAEGGDSLRWMVTILGLPARAVDIGEPGHTWPSVYGPDWNDLTPAEMDTIRPLFDEEDLEFFAEFGGYIGYRLGITDSGDWTFFVAGD